MWSFNMCTTRWRHSFSLEYQQFSVVRGNVCKHTQKKSNCCSFSSWQSKSKLLFFRKKCKLSKVSILIHIKKSYPPFKASNKHSDWHCVSDKSFQSSKRVPQPIDLNFHSLKFLRIMVSIVTALYVMDSTRLNKKH